MRDIRTIIALIVIPLQLYIYLYCTNVVHWHKNSIFLCCLQFKKIKFISYLWQCFFFLLFVRFLWFWDEEQHPIAFFIMLHVTERIFLFHFTSIHSSCKTGEKLFTSYIRKCKIRSDYHSLYQYIYMYMYHDLHCKTNYIWI